MTKHKKKPWMFIAWSPHSRRSEIFAQELGAELHCVHYLKFQAPLYAPPKYILQAIRTLWILFTKRPSVVFVQNPPFICGLVVAVYCRITGAQFIFDHHSAAFASVWNWALPIQKRLARQATVNIVTNQHWADIIASWRARALIMGDPFVELPEGEAFPVEPGFTIAFIQTFAPDEPLEAVLAAASQATDVHLYITGDSSRKPDSFFANQPSNVTFTGFLPDPRYIGLLRAVDAIMVLTTRDHTLQLGGCEAVSVGKPLLVSDWPFLQQFFYKGAVYVSNSPGGILQGIRQAQQQHTELQQAILALRQDNQQEWRTKLAQLKNLINL
jgi:glycosyltransferase involved in cell wall biosynthesis